MSNQTHAYTRLLEGCHSGANAFQIYLENTEDIQLKRILTEGLDLFKKHEKMITEHISQLGKDASDEEPMMAMVANFFEKVKVAFSDTDDTIDLAINAMDMGIKGLQTFLEEHQHCNCEMRKVLETLFSDYKHVYQKLTDYKLTRVPF